MEGKSSLAIKRALDSGSCPFLAFQKFQEKKNRTEQNKTKKQYPSDSLEAAAAAEQ